MKDSKKPAEKIPSEASKTSKSAKTVIRVLQGLGLGIILYFSIPFLIYILLGQASRNLSYMNVLCPDDDRIFFDPQSREIFVFQRQNRQDRLEVTATTENSVVLKMFTEGDDSSGREMVFEVDTETIQAGEEAAKGFTIKSVQLELDCIPSNEYDEASILILLTFVSGATGSVISILSRVSDYHGDEYGDSALPFYIGLFKPVIGGAFGVFIFAILASGLIQVSNPLNTRDNLDSSINIDKWLFFIGISFVGGFSERLAKDIISVTEDHFKVDSDEGENHTEGD